MKLFLLCFMFAGCCTIAVSQTVVKGVISDSETTKGFDNATITIQEKGKSAIKVFTSTDQKGRYELKYGGESDSLIISVSGFNVKKQSRKIENKSQTIDFTVENQIIELKEVSIKPPKIRQHGDTLNYTVSSFTDANDRSIGDVLKKMPGIQVAESGQIYYQNKPINKFYIEDMDLLQGRYGVATNNVQAKDVSAVQVLENHQPVKALKDKEFSEDAAINLKLKESAKGVFLANAQLGVGVSPLLLSNELTGMEFSKKRQNMLIYKGDNSGRNIANELNSFYANMERGTQVKLLQVQKPSPPSITQQRHLFNNSHMGTVNDLRKINKEYTLTSNINYIFDKDKRSSISNTDYYLPGSSVLNISDIANSRLYKNMLKGSTKLEANTDQLYFNNELSINGEWDRESGNNFASDSVSQNLWNPSFGISNVFDLTNRNKDKILKLHSTISYKDLSQRLSVAPILYADLFGLEETEGRIIQKADMQNFYTYNSVSWGTKLGVDIDFKLSFMADLQHLKSDLSAFSVSQGIYQTADSLSNNLRWNTYEWNLSPSVRHTFFSKFRVSFHPGLRYIILSENDVLSKQSASHHYFYFDPSLAANYKISPMWEANMNYNYNNRISGIQDAYTGYLMSSYRNLLKNDGNINKNRSHALWLYINHKNPLTTLFANLHVNYTNMHRNLLNEYYYSGILRIKSSVEHPNTSQNFSTSANIGKDISSIRSTISLRSNYGINQSVQLSQGEKTDYQSQYVSISPSFISRFGSYANLDYRLNFRTSWGKVDNSISKLPTINSFSQKITANLYPVKNLVLGLSCENFYNDAIVSGDRWMWFGDIVIRYKWKGVDLMLDYNNVLNTRKYISTSYSDIGRYSYSYKLRPAEVLFRIKLKLK